MSPGALLNADMATIGRMLREAWRWWIEELSALIPPTLRRSGARRGPTITFDAGSGRLAVDPARRPGKAELLIAANQVLQRTIVVPAMSRGDLARMLVLNSERYLPLPGKTVLVASEIAGRDETDGRLRVAIAGLPVTTARAVADAVAASGVTPLRVGVAADDRHFDFLPAMREAGLIAGPGRGLAQWWLFVGFLFALNLGLLVWRDSAEVERLETLVDAQRPAVQAAQRIVQRMRRSDAIVRDAAARRGRRDAVAMLALATVTMPDGAWVQRYSWDGQQLRLTGYKAADVNVVSAFRQLPAIASVKSAQTDMLAEVGAGQPFDIVAQLRRE